MIAAKQSALAVELFVLLDFSFEFRSQCFLDSHLQVNDFYAALFVVIKLEGIEFDNALGVGDGHQMSNIIHNKISQLVLVNRRHKLRFIEAD